MPTVSGILCNYNHAHFIRDALDAMLQQSAPPKELIVVDDGSTDDSVAIVKAYQQRYPNVILARNERNLGWAPSANRALAMATGDYVYFGASDDHALPGLFEKTLAMVARYPDAGFCCSDPGTFVGETGEVNENRLRLSAEPRYFSPDEVAAAIKRINPWLSSHSAIIRRSAILEAGGLQDPLRWHADFFVLYVTGLRYGLCYVPEPLAMLRVRADSYLAAGRRDWPTQRAVLEHLLGLLKEPQFADVLPRFRDSGALYITGPEVLRVVLRHPEHHDMLMPLVSQWMRDKARRAMTQMAPQSLRRLVRRRRYGKGS